MIMMPPKFVAFDLETTGLNNQKDEIIEIGAVKFSVQTEKGIVVPKLEKEFQTFVKPNMMIPAEASSVNHIYDKDVENAPSVGEAIKAFTAFCGQSSILIAHNANFDAGFLRVAYQKNPQIIPGNPIVDSLAISKSILPEASSHKLGILAAMFQRSNEIGMKIESDKAHRAVYDCLMLMEVFVALLRRRFKEKDWEMATIMKNLEKYKGTAQFLNK
ncbi:MAG: 3'-5' exonuclease [Fibrobacter sp.]|nr:3'-5' exonuclease [Fibrobacter sp.]